MVTEQLLLNNYVGAVNSLKQLEDKYDQMFQKVLSDLRALKAGEVGLDSLVVTDNGWEVMLAPPKVEAEA